MDYSVVHTLIRPGAKSEKITSIFVVYSAQAYTLKSPNQWDFLNSLPGNAGVASPEELTREFGNLLTENESVESVLN